MAIIGLLAVAAGVVIDERQTVPDRRPNDMGLKFLKYRKGLASLPQCNNGSSSYCCGPMCNRHS
ncbi:hypothetical protein [Novosphingobium olei]|uniref:hypothetical protein n=1 Tax=Novosphingobium olei TaxID=2728851 RepID=UPI00308B08F2|nr:hypothetical protein NSDW_05850 [Novosphingobium olei]